MAGLNGPWNGTAEAKLWSPADLHISVETKEKKKKEKKVFEVGANSKYSACSCTRFLQYNHSLNTPSVRYHSAGS